MVAALLSVAVYDYNAVVLVHLHGVLVVVLRLMLLYLYYMAVGMMNATMLIMPQIQADIHACGLGLVIECKECYTGDYCYLYNEFFHGLCFLCVLYLASCPVH